jgi:peptidoglycan-N-acetylglucosamine deacetylase
MESLIVVCILALLGILYYLFLSPESQVFGRFPYRVNTRDKIVALTFDDGPNPSSTGKILEILIKYNVKVTFFVCGQNVENNPALTRAIADGGHTLGNHSWSHNFGKYFDEPSFKEDISRTQEIVRITVGRAPALFRPPWLFRYPGLLKTLKSNHMTPVSGVFGSELEVFQPPAKMMANRAMTKLKPGVILIFHDGFDTRGGNRSRTVEAMDLLIPRILAEGYRFVTVDDLLNIKAQ